VFLDVLPFTVTCSMSDVRLSGSFGFERLTVRDRVSVRVRPEGVRIVVVAIGAWIPNRGSGDSVLVTEVPSGCVTEVD